MRILYGFVVVFVFVKNANAQNDFSPGYIITAQKDTVTGLVKHTPGRTGGMKIEFKKQESASADIYDPGKIAGFGYFAQDRYFATIDIDSGEKAEKVFAEMLFKGRANLYLYDNFFYLQKDTLTEKIEKVKMREAYQGDGRYVYAHKTYIGILNRYFSDCLPPKLLRGQVAYSERDFVDVFKKYSECSGVGHYAYKTAPQGRKIKFYALGGFNISSVKFPESDMDIFKRDNNFFLAGGITLPLVFISNNAFITAEAAYHRNIYNGKRAGFTPSGSVQKDYTMELTLVKMPVGVKVNLTKQALTPYLRGGLTPFIPLRGNWTIRYQGTTEADYDVEEKTASLVYWGGLGFEQVLGNKSFFMELRVEKFIDYIGFYGPNGATNIPSSVFNKMVVFGVNF